MGFDFLTDLSNMQVEIPPEVSRLAGFFVLLQGGMIYLQKKNNPAKDIWEDLSWVFLGGLFVYLFPELIRFMETLVNALMPIELHADSAIAEFMKESNLGDGSVPPPDSSTSFGNILMNAFLKSRSECSGLSNRPGSPETFCRPGELPVLPDVSDDTCRRAEGYLLERPVDFGAGGHVAFPVALEAVVYDLYRPAGLRPHVVCRGFLLRGMFQNLRFGRKFAHPRLLYDRHGPIQSLPKRHGIEL